MGSVLRIKWKEIAINIKQKGVAITVGVIFPVLDGEKQPGRTEEDTVSLQHTCPIPPGYRKQGGPVKLGQGDVSIREKS